MLVPQSGGDVDRIVPVHAAHGRWPMWISV
jgi:hypothetical protein